MRPTTGRGRQHMLLSVLLICLAGLQVVIDPSVVMAAADPCREDIERFCRGSGPGQKSTATCLKDHEFQLSKACSERRMALKRQSTAFREACSKDVKRYCRGVKGGRYPIIQCLKRHEVELGPICADFLRQ